MFRVCVGVVCLCDSSGFVRVFGSVCTECRGTREGFCGGARIVTWFLKIRSRLIRCKLSNIDCWSIKECYMEK